MLSPSVPEDIHDPMSLHIRIAELETALAESCHRADALQQALAKQEVERQVQLREQQNRYQLLFETMAQGVVYYAADGSVIDANPAAQHILGLSLEQFRERSSATPRWRVVRADGSDFPQEEFPARFTLRTGQPVLGAVMGIDDPRSQYRRWLSINAIPLFHPGESTLFQVYTTFADITVRIEAEEQLRQSEARFATIFAHSPIALGISRLSDGRIVDVNTAYLTLYGYPREAVIGRTTLELGIWTRPEERQHVLDQIRTQQRISSFQAVAHTASGAQCPVLLSGEIVPINDEPHVLMQIMDISALKQAQQELQDLNHTLETRVQQRTAEVRELYDILRQANAELIRAARSKDEFLASMSHELRTPINAILGYSESLQEQIYGPITERQHGAIGHVEASGRHLLTLINDILDLAKVEAGRLDLQTDLVLVQDVCHASLGFVREQALRKRLQLGLQVNEPDALINADGTRLKQILVNLLSNAVKFTPAGGAVGLDVTVDAEEGVTLFTVHDTGIGIASEDLGRLFQPFSQIDSRLSRESEGTGLGLALVRRLAEAHGGSVTVESMVGRGSHFTIALPYQPPLARPATSPSLPTPTPAEPMQDSLAHGRILLADDNEANVNAICDYLHARGYQISIARDGYEALVLADEVQPNLILMDIQMPRLDGLAAIRRLRALPAYAATPIIALTALAMPGDEARCLEAGASEYMAKPVSVRALARAVQRLLKPV